MRFKASNRLLAPMLLAAALLAPLGFAVAAEGGPLGDLFRDLLGEGTQETAPAAPETAPAPAPPPATADTPAPAPAPPGPPPTRRPRPPHPTSACRSAVPRWSCPSRRW